MSETFPGRYRSVISFRGSKEDGKWSSVHSHTLLLSSGVTLVLTHSFCRPPPRPRPETHALANSDVHCVPICLQTAGDGKDDRGIVALSISEIYYIPLPQKRRLIILISTAHHSHFHHKSQHGPTQSESLDAKEGECCRCRKNWVSCPTHRIEGVPYNTSFIGPNTSFCIAYAPPVPTAKSRCTVE